jgi:uncharacterized OB-fold protein
MRGIYEDTFWNFVQQSEIRLQRSTSGRFRYPPAPVDPQTLDPVYEWVPINGTGNLVAWTVFHRQYFPDIPTPYIVGAVRIPEGPMLFANIVGANSEDLRHAMPMTITYERTTTDGHEWQIFQWQPDISTNQQQPPTT